MIGQRVGRYEILEELGRGGMGVVYGARDTVLGRTVALKALPTDRASDPERRRRFLNEARSASGLDHPNIVTVHDLLEEEGSDWIVMEHVEGRTLDEVIPSDGLPVAQALGWAADATDALRAAHEAGIIHRDVKPGNLMIDPSGRVRVLDFGLAKLDLLTEPYEDGATRTAPMTLAGTVLGTLEYMSPEQALGRTVDPRSDVFSLGAVLYQMLTGRRPFGGANAASKIHAVAFEQPAPPEELRPETPQAVSALVLRALEKDPDDRFQTMGEMGEALRSVLRRPSGGAEDAAGAGGIEDRWRALGRLAPGGLRGVRPKSWGPTAVAALILTAVVAAGAAFLVPGWEPALPGTSYAKLKQASELLDAWWREGYLERAIETLQRVLDEDPDYAPAYAALADAYVLKHTSEGDPLWLKRARAQSERAMALDPALSRARASHARVLLEQRETEAARKEIEELLARDPMNARGHWLLGLVHEDAGDPEGALSLYDEAASLDPDEQLYPASRGFVLFHLGRYELAVEAFRRQAELADDQPAAYSSLAAALQMAGRTGEAAEELQRAIEIRPNPVTYSNLGTLYFFQGLYPQALEAFERAVGLGANNYLIWNNLGDAYRWTPGREGDARRAYTRALQLLEEQLERSPSDPTLRSRRALLLAKRGSEGDRTDALAEARALEIASAGPSLLYRIALTYEISGDRERALEALGGALERGYSATEVERDPELTALRRDPRYHLIMVDHDGAA